MTKAPIRTTVRKLAEALGIADLARAASTPEQHAEIVRRLEANLGEARSAVTKAEARGDTLYLEGGDLVTHVRELTEARATVETVERNLASAAARLIESKQKADAAAKAARRAAAEQALPKLQAALRQGLEDYIEQLVSAVAQGAIVGETFERIHKHSKAAREDGFDELVLDPNSLAATVVAEMTGLPEHAPKPPAPIPMPSRPKLNKLSPTESDESVLSREERELQGEMIRWRKATDLAIGNYIAQTNDLVRSHNPFRRLRAAIEAQIEAYASAGTAKGIEAQRADIDLAARQTRIRIGAAKWRSAPVQPT
jgi:hypothetical protein